jgi:hypothetical protein
MEKIKAKLHSLSKDRRYMIFVGVVIVFNGFIGLASAGLAAFLGLIIGPLCLLVGYYGSDIKKGMEEFKHDISDAKDLAQKSVELAKESAEKATDVAKKATDVARNSAGKAVEMTKKVADVAQKTVPKATVSVKKLAAKK